MAVGCGHNILVSSLAFHQEQRPGWSTHALEESQCLVSLSSCSSCISTTVRAEQRHLTIHKWLAAFKTREGNGGRCLVTTARKRCTGEPWRAVLPLSLSLSPGCALVPCPFSWHGTLGIRNMLERLMGILHDFCSGEKNPLLLSNLIFTPANFPFPFLSPHPLQSTN